MLSFFKRKKVDIKLDGKESTIQADKIVKTGSSITGEAIYPEIYFHPQLTVPAEHQYVLRFMNKELPPLKPNQINLSGISIDMVDNNIEVTAFIRNSLATNFKLNETKLVLFSEKEEVIAKRKFSLENLGEIPASSSIPWIFTFSPDTIELKEFSKTGFSLKFDLTPPHELYLSEEEEGKFSDEQKEKLRTLIKSLTEHKENTINFTPFQITSLEEGFIFSIIVRNFYTNKQINLEKLPLQLYDADDDLFSNGHFVLENFSVPANKSRLLTLQTKNKLKDEPNLTTWHVRTT